MAVAGGVPGTLASTISRLLADRGFVVVGEPGDADGLLRLVEHARPDAALVDIKMPPTHTDEGLRAATEIRERHPGTAVLLLSSYLDVRYAATPWRAIRVAPATC